MASLINVFPSVQQQLIPPKNYAKYELLLFFQTSFMLSCELKVGECLKEGRKNGSIILKHFVCDDIDGKLYLNVLLVVEFFFARNQVLMEICQGYAQFNSLKSTRKQAFSFRHF